MIQFSSHNGPYDSLYLNPDRAALNCGLDHNTFAHSDGEPKQEVTNVIALDT